MIRRLLLTTDPGLDDLVVAELSERDPDTRLEQPAEAADGRVLVESAASDATLAGLGLVHDVVEVCGVFRASTLDEVRVAAKSIDVSRLARAGSFRVRTESGGQLDRKAVERAVGGSLQGRYGTAVSLEQPEVVVRAEGAGDIFYLGVQLNHEPLSKRIRRGAALRSSLRPTVAAALVRLAGAHRGSGRLIDPLCGSGVIPVEAARANPALSVEAADWDEPTVAVAAQTFANHGLEIRPAVSDARSLGASRPSAFRAIVTDPPYGMRQGRRANLGTLYGDLLESFRRALAPGGRLALVVVRHRLLLRAAERSGLAILHERKVDAAGLSLRLFVLEPARGLRPRA